MACADGQYKCTCVAGKHANKAWTDQAKRMGVYDPLDPVQPSAMPRHLFLWLVLCNTLLGGGGNSLHALGAWSHQSAILFHEHSSGGDSSKCVRPVHS